MATLQVRSVDNQLYDALKARAKMESRSISQEVITIIKDYLSKPYNQHENTTDQFLQICGSWSDDRPESEIAESIRKSRTNNDQRLQDLL